MCYNCGCGLPADDMGHPDNITTKTFQEVSSKTGKSVEDVKDEMKNWLSNELGGNHTPNPVFDEVFQKASQAWGQNINEAKKETLKLLEKKG